MIGKLSLVAFVLFVTGGVEALQALPLLYGLYLAFLWYVQCQLLFPTTHLVPPDGPLPKGCRSKWVDDGSSSSEAWFFEGCHRGRKMPTVFLFHANGEHINSYVGVAVWFTKHGFNVMVPEYRGYGKSVGIPTEAGVVSDVLQHIFNLERTERAFDASRLVYFGASVGGGIASAVAVKHPPMAIMLLSTFYSIPRNSVDYCIPEAIARIILCNIYDNRKNLERVMNAHRVPIFISHGTEDMIVPLRQAQALTRELGLKLHTRRCGHNDFYFDDQYKTQVLEFLKPFAPVQSTHLRPASP
ncbi:Protein bem46 [Diplonema papillatum]|nr:Protein bem46 [Diplonema papillatum]